MCYNEVLVEEDHLHRSHLHQHHLLLLLLLLLVVGFLGRILYSKQIHKVLLDRLAEIISKQVVQQHLLQPREHLLQKHLLYKVVLVQNLLLHLLYKVHYLQVRLRLLHTKHLLLHRSIPQ